MAKKKFTRIDIGSLGTVGAVIYETGDGFMCKVSPSNGHRDDNHTPQEWIGITGTGETAEEAHRACKNLLLRAAYN